jgi:hypothetical protein
MNWYALAKTAQKHPDVLYDPTKQELVRAVNKSDRQGSLRGLILPGGHLIVGPAMTYTHDALAQLAGHTPEDKLGHIVFYRKKWGRWDDPNRPYAYGVSHDTDGYYGHTWEYEYEKAGVENPREWLHSNPAISKYQPDFYGHFHYATPEAAPKPSVPGN